MSETVESLRRRLWHIRPADRYGFRGEAFVDVEDGDPVSRDRVVALMNLADRAESVAMAGAFEQGRLREDIDDAEAELKELHSTIADYVGELAERDRTAPELERQLATRDKLLSSTVDLHAKALNQLAERDRVDAKLLATFKAQTGDWQNIERTRAVFVRLSEWAAARGGK